MCPNFNENSNRARNRSGPNGADAALSSGTMSHDQTVVAPFVSRDRSIPPTSSSFASAANITLKNFNRLQISCSAELDELRGAFIGPCTISSHVDDVRARFSIHQALHSLHAWSTLGAFSPVKPFNTTLPLDHLANGLKNDKLQQLPLQTKKKKMTTPHRSL